MGQDVPPRSSFASALRRRFAPVNRRRSDGRDRCGYRSGKTRGGMTRPPILCYKDTREPDFDAGDAEDAVFTPCIFAPGQRRDLPFADRIRLPLPYERRALTEGDYAPANLRGMVAVERKSGGDLLATIFGNSGVDSCGERMDNLDRFREELRRVRAARYEL